MNTCQLFSVWGFFRLFHGFESIVLPWIMQKLHNNNNNNNNNSTDHTQQWPCSPCFHEFWEIFTGQWVHMFKYHPVTWTKMRARGPGGCHIIIHLDTCKSSSTFSVSNLQSENTIQRDTALPPLWTWLNKRLPDWRWSWLPLKCSAEGYTSNPTYRKA